MESEQARLLVVFVEAARRAAPESRAPFAALNEHGRAEVINPELNPRPNVYFGDLLALEQEGYLMARTLAKDRIIFDVSPRGFEKYGDLRGSDALPGRVVPDLTEPQRLVLGTIWQSFTDSCEWPIYQWLDLSLSREKGIELESELRALPDGLVLWDQNPRDDSPVRLTIRGLTMVSGSLGDQSHFLHALRWLVKKESELRFVPGQTSVLQLSSAQVAEEWTQDGGEGDSLSITKAGALLEVESLYLLSGLGRGQDRTEWNVTVDLKRIRRFRNVQTMSDYLHVVDQMELEWAKMRQSVPTAVPWVQNESGSTGQDGQPDVAVTGATAYIFVVMPFNAAWSDDTYEAIKLACQSTAADIPLHFERADEISKPGRITRQIIDAITKADVVIADITDDNPNVMYEVGYADALQKPVVVLNQRVHNRPFDLFDMRQIGYETGDLAGLSARIEKMIRAELAPTSHMASVISLADHLEVVERSYTFQAREVAYEWLGTALSLECKNRSPVVPLMNCRAWIAELRHDDEGGGSEPVRSFSPMYLLWDTNEESLSLAPDETRRCELVTQLRDVPLASHLSRVTTEHPWALDDGVYTATIQWRADNLRPFTRNYRFQVANRREPDQIATLSFVASDDLV